MRDEKEERKKQHVHVHIHVYLESKDVEFVVVADH